MNEEIDDIEIEVPKEIKDRKKVVSFSQFSMFGQCKKKFKLKYIDKLGKSESNIHSVFGTAMHETIQHFLTVMYGESKKAALNINTDKLLYENLIKAFQIDQKKMDGEPPCTKEELIEFYNDGQNILQYLRGKLNKFYPKQGYELIAIEYKIEEELKPGVIFWGFIDIVLFDKISGKYIVIDLKTSTKGWNKYQKNDKKKTSQILIYKRLYSGKENIDEKDINVEYQILKRKIDSTFEYPIPRISKFIPANGKPSVNSAWKDFMEFVDYVYNENGALHIPEDFRYPPTPGKLCDWCEFKSNGICKSWK